jgi:hypothetical protein
MLTANHPTYEQGFHCRGGRVLSILFVVVQLNINGEQKGNALVLKASNLGPVVIRQQTEQSDSHQRTPDGSRGVGGGMDRRDLG